MAEISKIASKNTSAVYDIKDKYARDAIGELKNVTIDQAIDFASIVKDRVSASWTLGGIKVNDGNVIRNDSTRIRSNGYFSVEDVSVVYTSSTAKAALRFYSNNTGAPQDIYIGYKDFSTGSIDIREAAAKHENANYVRVVAAYNDNREIEDIDALASNVVICSGNDTSITELESKIETASSELESKIETASSELESKIEEIGTYAIDGLSWAIRAMNSTTGAYTESTNRITTNGLVKVPSSVLVTADTGAQINVFGFDDKLSPVPRTVNAWKDSHEITGAAFLNIAARYSDNREIDASGMEELASKIHVKFLKPAIDQPSDKIPKITYDAKTINPDDPAATYRDYPILVATKDHHESGKPHRTVGFLYRESHEPFNFYYSDGETLQRIFSWDKSVTDNGARLPIDYSFCITAEGDVIAVWRGERSYFSGQRTDDMLRKNPIVYPHDDYEHPIMVNITETDQPTNWLQNSGVYCETGTVYMAEYTRFSHKKAYVWKIAAPYTNPDNWKIVQEFTVGGTQDKFKHIHMIDRDPYSGILYMSTGDKNEYPVCFWSADDGITWTPLGSASEMYWRQLNFVWTETYVYWATDTTANSMHYLYRCKRDATTGLLDIGELEDGFWTKIDRIFHFDKSQATYNVCYCEKPHGLLILDRYDDARNVPLTVWFYDLDYNKMKIIDYINPKVSDNGGIGFRVDAINKYDFHGKFYCGFSNYVNQMDLLNNIGCKRFLVTTDALPVDDSDLVGVANNMIISLAESR